MSCIILILAQRYTQGGIITAIGQSCIAMLPAYNSNRNKAGNKTKDLFIKVSSIIIRYSKSTCCNTCMHIIFRKSEGCLWNDDTFFRDWDWTIWIDSIRVINGI